MGRRNQSAVSAELFPSFTRRSFPTGIRDGDRRELREPRPCSLWRRNVCRDLAAVGIPRQVQESPVRGSSVGAPGCSASPTLPEFCADVSRRAESVPRQGTGVRSGWKNTFELERVASCCSVDHRWVTKLDFSSGESFDDHHWPTTLGTRPKIAGIGGAGLLLSLRCPAEQLEAKWQGGGTFAVGQEAEVADTHETRPTLSVS